MKKKKHPFRKFVLFLLFLGMIYLGYYSYFERDFFVITEVNIIAQNRVTNDEVLELLGERPYYINYTNKELTDMVTKHPLIKTCDVKKYFPNGIDVIIKERQPVIALSYTERFLLIDEDLVIVESSLDRKGYYEVQNYDFKSFQKGVPISSPDEYILENIISLVYMLHIVELDDSTHIKIEDQEIVLVFTSTLSAKLGDGENIEERFNKVYKFYKYLEADGNAVGTIIMNHDGQPSLEPFEN